MVRYRLPPKTLEDLIDARTFDLYDDPMASLADLQLYAVRTSAALIGMAARILSDGRDVAGDIAGHAGIAYAVAGLLRAFPLHAARHQLYIPADVLERHQVKPEHIFAGQESTELRAVLAELRLHVRQHLESANKLASDAPSVIAPALLPVTLVRPTVAKPTAPKRTNSGSVASSTPVRARTAQAHRIWVEGRHDAELVEHVWGDDLRELGIVVEPMHGLDDVVSLVAEFAPGPDRRLGVLVDHLVPGSKEDRLARSVSGPHVLVTGHPFVDVWEGVWPKVVGIEAWPAVPKGRPWKDGVCAALGADPATFWPTLRNRVRTFADLRPELVGAVERLIDFVAPPAD